MANAISISGNIANDPELKHVGNNNTPCLEFTVADTVGYGQNEVTNWWRCSIWGKRGESLAAHLEKGKNVTVFGEAKLRPWDNQEGVKQLSPEINVDRLAFGGGGQQKPAQQKPATPPAAKPEDLDDDIPF